MNRFNAILAVFAILLVIWLIEAGAPRVPRVSNRAQSQPEVPLQPAVSQNIFYFDILSATDRVSASRDTSGIWQVDADQLQLVEEMAVVIDLLLSEAQQLVEFDASDDLSQYGLDVVQRRYEIRFGSIIFDQRYLEVLVVGSPTPNQQEFYAVLVNIEDTSIYRGEWVYRIPAVYIERLDALLSSLEEHAQSRGQTTVP